MTVEAIETRHKVRFEHGFIDTNLVKIKMFPPLGSKKMPISVYKHITHSYDYNRIVNEAASDLFNRYSFEKSQEYC